MRQNNKKHIVFDLFAGAGGFGLGFKLAGESYNVKLSLEVDKWAVETLKANVAADHLVVEADIRTFTSVSQIRRLTKISPDVIIGGPPCQGFSNAGPVKDANDPRNSLFKNFAYWVEVLKPKVFVMENVKGLLTRRNDQGEKVVDIIKQTFEGLGYATNIWKLNAANYGVPQIRERIFIVGAKSGETIPAPPISHVMPSDRLKFNGAVRHLPNAITVINAIGDLPPIASGEGSETSNCLVNSVSEYQIALRGKEVNVYNHVPMLHTKRMIKRYEAILNGSKLEQLNDELKVKKRNGNGSISETEYKSNYRHLKPNMVSYTIPASFYSNFIHPNQPRNITSREAARLQSFPDFYVFKGKRTQISSKLLKKLGKDDQNYLSQYNQIGNAVPPELAKLIALHLLNYL